MALPASPNPISMSHINNELALPSNAQISLNDAAVRTLFVKNGSGSTISIGDGRVGWGKPSSYSTITLNNPNPYDTSYYDQFGNTVAISGNYVIVGTYVEEEGTAQSSGQVYVYNATTGSLIRRISNPNAYDTSEYDFFGTSVAASGNRMIAGAFGEDDANIDHGSLSTSAGKAYIFNLSTGALLYTLNNPNPIGFSSNDQFGYVVSISDSFALVSAIGEGDDTTVSNAGKVYVYDANTGAYQRTISNPNAYGTSLYDSFGYRVAISGNTAIISAHAEDTDASNQNSGKVYIYDVSTGTLLYTLDDPNAYGTAAFDLFGQAVGISGKYAIVGAPSEDDAGGTNSGKAYIYDVTTGALVRTLNNPNPYGTSLNDEFGYAVAISDGYAVVCAHYEDDDAAVNGNAGKAYVFNVETGQLVTTISDPNAYGTTAGDLFGQAVAINNKRIVVGTPYENDAGGNYSGKVYIFTATS